MYHIKKQNYDIAICQAVLQHIPNGLSIIDKMRDSIVEGGKVICIELNININNSILHIDVLMSMGFVISYGTV